MKQVFTLITISLAIVFSLSSQEKADLKDTFQEAEFFILYEDYAEAVALYNKLVRNGFTNSYIDHRIGECYLHIPGQKHKSIPYLERAIENISDNIKEGSFNETKAPTRTLFYLGGAYQVTNQLDKAIEMYEKFKESLDVQDIYNIDYVDQQIQSCKNAKELMVKPLRVNKFNMGEVINNGFSNITPVISSDEKSIVFITKLQFYDAIFYAEKEGESWSTPINITPHLKSDGDLYPCYLSGESKTLLLFKYEGFSGDIYQSKFENGRWQAPKKLNKNINSRFLESHATLSSDGQTMYFVSDRKGGYGGFDIYKSVYNETKETWGEAINLGPAINTSLDEETPQISEDGKVLFFSSQGHYNMGGFDIFQAHKIGENEWTDPVNIGYPINTTDDDLFYYPLRNGSIAYMSLFDEDSYGQKDIYRLDFSIPEKPSLVNVRGKVTLQDNQTDFNKNNFSIEVLDSAKVEIIERLNLDENTGNFSAELSAGSYRFIFKSKEYKQEIKTVIIPKDYNREELVVNVELIPLAVTTGEYITIKSIYFGFDEYLLDRDSKVELERLYNLMTKYPSLHIEVIGHTDSKGSQEYNKKLSVKRAQSVIDYLTVKGINKSRFVAKGVGMEQPMAININPDGSDSPEGRKFNRRVEMKILKSDDKLVTKEETTIPNHLINRNLSYCILIAKTKNELPNDYFDKYEELKDQKIKKFHHKEYIYVWGDCKEKSELIETFNTLLDLGFNDAKIISNYDLKNMLPYSEPKFTIQLSAGGSYEIINSEIKSYEEKGIKVYVEKKQVRGKMYYRIRTGKFDSYAEAKKELVRIKKLFPKISDLWIDNMNDFQ